MAKDPKVSAILLGIGKKKPGTEEESGDDEGEGTGELSTGAQALADYDDAMGRGDFEAAYEAFERAVAMCKPPGYEEEPGDEGV